MEKEILQLFSNLTERDRDIQYESYEELMKIMQEPVCSVGTACTSAYI